MYCQLWKQFSRIHCIYEIHISVQPRVTVMTGVTAGALSCKSNVTMVSFSLSFFLIAKNARCNWRNKLAWLMPLSFSLRDIVHQQHSRKMCTLFCKKKSRLILKHKRREAWRSRVNPLHIWYQDTKYAMESRVQLSYLVIVQNLSQSRPLPGDVYCPMQRS